MKAIVYTSNTGHTEQYAKMLSEKTGIPVYELSEAKNLEQGSDIIYMGWLMAGGIKGYKKVVSRFNVKAVAAVGMSGDSSQYDSILKTNSIGDNTKLFYLQGGFEMEKLHGMYKFMMNTMKKTAGKALAGKTDRTPEEDDMLNLLLNGGNRVSIDNLNGIIQWISEQDIK